jgi:hypothetical protein
MNYQLKVLAIALFLATLAPFVAMLGTDTMILFVTGQSSYDSFLGLDVGWLVDGMLAIRAFLLA